MLSQVSQPFGAPLRIGFAGTTDHAGVALGATVGFGTSAFFQDGAAIYMGDDSDLKDIPRLIE